MIDDKTWKELEKFIGKEAVEDLKGGELWMGTKKPIILKHRKGLSYL